jgi:hypothetical protein
VDAWETKEKRQDVRLASMQLLIAQSQGVKVNNRKPRLTDFLPEYAKPKDGGQSALMKEVEEALAKQKTLNG